MQAILIDDEQLALDILEHHLHKISNINVIGKYLNPREGKEKILESNVDVVFLDIDLPTINGIELAEQILEEKPDQMIIFVTAYDEYAVEAFNLSAMDYIVKPVRTDRLEKALSRVQMQLENQPVIKDAFVTELEVNMSGQLTITDSRGENNRIHWRTSKAQELFLYLLHHHENIVQKAVIADTLWPDFEADRAYSQLYTTIYHIRKVLRSYEGHFKIKSMQNGYILLLKSVKINVEEWEQALETAPPLNIQTIHTYIKIMDKYTGAYLGSYNYIWAEAERYRLEQLWLKVSFQIADLYRAYDYTEMAIDSYEKIIREVPGTEEAYFSLMKIYAGINNHVLVQHQYEQLKEVLEEQLDVLPNEEISNWYHKWKKSTTII